MPRRQQHQLLLCMTRTMLTDVCKEQQNSCIPWFLVCFVALWPCLTASKQRQKQLQSFGSDHTMPG